MSKSRRSEHLSPSKDSPSAVKPVLLTMLICIVLAGIAGGILYFKVYQPLNQVELHFISGGEEIGACTVSRGTEVQLPIPAAAEGYAFEGWKNAAGDLVASDTVTAEKDTVYQAVYAVVCPEGEHDAYLLADENGLYRPSDDLTRAEAVQLFYILSGSPSTGSESYSDVPRKASYKAAAAFAKSLALIDGEKLYPDRSVTGQELFDMACRVWPLAELRADGIKNASDPIKRCEAAQMINALIGRSADEETLQGIFAAVPDASPNAEWYADFAEAALSHQAEQTESGEKWTDVEQTSRFEPGFNTINGSVYYVQEDGSLAIDTKVGNLLFDEAGRYTSGNSELDEIISDILQEITTDDMTQEEKLRAAFEYVVKNISYRKGNVYDVGETGWAAEEALSTLTEGYGNCYGFAASFCELARALQYDAIEYSGIIPQDSDTAGAMTEHGWVEIEIDGVNYIFDAELSYVSGKDMYKMAPDSSYVLRWKYDRSEEAAAEMEKIKQYNAQFYQ